MRALPKARVAGALLTVALLAAAFGSGAVGVGGGLGPTRADALSPVPAPTGPGWSTTAVLPSEFRTISCFSRQRCMAAGNDGVAAATTDGGATWTSHRVAGTRATLSGVACPTATTCWISLLEPGRTAEVARTNDFGATWSVGLSGLWSSPSAVACVSATHCWVAGQDDGAQPELAVTTDGNTWSIVGVLGSEDFPGYFTSVSCPAENHCFAVGGKTVPGGHTVLLFATTDGVNWVNQSTPAPLSVVRSVSCADNTHCLAVGVRLYASIPTDHASFALATTDGSTWHDVTLPSPLHNVDAVSCPTSGGGQDCVVLASDTALVTTDGGTTWAAHAELSGPGVGTAGLSCVDTQACWGATGSAATGGPVTHSADGGATWSQQAVPAAVGPLHQVLCPSDSRCIGVGDSGIATSTDGGTTWRTTRVTPAALGAVSCGDELHCWAVGASGALLFATTDGGESWTPGVLPGGVAPTAFTGVACTSATHCVAGYQSSGGPGILRTDNGASWAPATVPAGLAYLGGFACGDGSHCVAVSSDPASGAASVLTTSDGGSHWSTSDLPGGAGRFTSAVTCGDALHCRTAAFDVPAKAYLYSSTDGGASWQPAGQPPVAVSALSCTDATHCWAAEAERGNHGPGGVWVTSNGVDWSAQGLPADAGLGAVSISCTPGWCRAVTQGSDPAGTAVGSTVIALSRTASGSFVTAAYTDLLQRPPTAAERRSAAVALDARPAARADFARTLASAPEWAYVVVRQLYLDSLNRAGDAGGVAFWGGQLASGRITTADLAARFYASDESYQVLGHGTPGGWVDDLYNKLLHRPADAAGRAYWVSVVGVKGRLAVAGQFFQSAESARTRVQTLYGALLGRAPDAGGLSYWSGVVVRVGDLALAANLVASGEYYQRAQQRFP